jgi:hypothetical protein
MTTDQITRLKKKFIEERQEFLQGKITTLQKQLFDKIFNKVISLLETSGGKIVSHSQNIELSAALDSIFKTFQSSEYTPVIAQFGNDLLKLSKFNSEYFSLIADKHIDRIKKLSDKANLKLAKQIGINEKGNINKNGYLDRLITDQTLKKEVKSSLLKAITNGKPVGEMTNQLRKIIIGNEKVKGGLVKHFDAYVRDTYTQFDSTSSSLMATGLGVKAFIYQGGKIKSSRCFCKERDGKVITIDEAQDWSDLLGEDCGPIWDEKVDGKYIPTTHRGGVNCRHTLDYISNSIAVQLRPDLKGKI